MKGEGERRLTCASFEDGDARFDVGQRQVDELVEAARPHDSGVEHIGPVRGSDDEDRLLGTDAVNLGQDLIDDAIARVGAPRAARATRLGDRVDFVEEEDARRRATRLVEELAHVGLGLA